MAQPLQQQQELDPLPSLAPNSLTDSYAVWEAELPSSDRDRDFILHGVQCGFDITDSEVPADFNTHCANYKSTSVNFAKVEAQILSELSTGNYQLCSQKPQIVSSLGAIPKSNGSIRLIHDLSRPVGGVNAYAQNCSCHYSTIDDATSLIPPGGWLAKVDLKAAYRSVPISPASYSLTGLSWKFSKLAETSYIRDLKLPFGSGLACRIFQCLSDAVAGMMRRRGLSVISYLDDFLVVGDSFHSCWYAFDTLCTLLQSLGFNINWDKVIPPCQSLPFLGVHLNTITRRMSLPFDKLQELRALIKRWIKKKSFTKRELQQIIGKLNWAAKVVKGGRVFLRRLIDQMTMLRRPHHHTRLSSAARADLEWWNYGLTIFHGHASFTCDALPPTGNFTTDACLVGGGAYYAGDWFYCHWQTDCPSMADAHINCLETQTILMAAYRWAHLWSGCHLRVSCDNTTSVAAINKGTSKSPVIMACLRQLFWLSVKFDFKITAHYLPGSKNHLADTISRLHELYHASLFFTSICDADMFVNTFGHMSQSTFLCLQSQLSLQTLKP